MPNLPTRRACERAGGASLGGFTGRRLGGSTQGDLDRTESTDGAERDGNRTDRTECLPVQAVSYTHLRAHETSAHL
eukprot:4898840-Alexandrium_andersonii.AAC.1